MKSSLALLAVFIFALTLSAPLAHAKGKETAEAEAAIKQLEQDWADAYVKADAAALDRIEADDFTMTDAAGEVSTKADEQRDTKSGALKITECKLEDLQVRVYGKAAVVTGVALIKGNYKGQDISGKRRFTDTLIHKKDVWKAVASQETAVPEKK